jgi:hypothetical protein
MAHLNGDSARAREIVNQTAPFAGGPLAAWLVVTDNGGTRENARRILEEYSTNHPVLEQYALDIANGPRLLGEELERWS